MDHVEFQDGTRTFTCHAASSPATPGTSWWWMTVTGEAQKYAAFRTEADDTPSKLRPRILAYYAQLLADRERPPLFRQHWAARRAAQTTAPAGEQTPATDAGAAADTTPGPIV